MTAYASFLATRRESSGARTSARSNGSGTQPRPEPLPRNERREEPTISAAETLTESLDSPVSLQRATSAPPAISSPPQEQSLDLSLDLSEPPPSTQPRTSDVSYNVAQPDTPDHYGTAFSRNPVLELTQCSTASKRKRREEIVGENAVEDRSGKYGGYNYGIG